MTMPSAAKPANESQRLEALKRLQLLDTTPEQCFEAITRCAKTATDAPVALITLIDEDRQFFMCRIGTDITETPRELSFCAHAIHTADPFIVPDLRLDPRFAENPLVAGPPYVQSYLGVPLVTSDGNFALGTLCVVDFKPRDWSPSQIAMIADLAKVAMTLVEARDLNRELQEAMKPAA